MLKIVCFSLCLGLIPLSVLGTLTIDNNDGSKLDGRFYHENTTDDIDVELVFNSYFEDGKIVSKTELLLVPSEDLQFPLVTLELPLEEKDNRKVSGLLPSVVKAAKVAVDALSSQPNSTDMFLDVALMYQEFVTELYRALKEDDTTLNQLHYSLLYHSSVMAGAYRISEGATEVEDICLVSPKYEYQDGVFMCTQDLQLIMMLTPGSDEPMPPINDLPLGMDKEEQDPRSMNTRYPDDAIMKESTIQSSIYPSQKPSTLGKVKLPPMYLPRGFRPISGRMWGCCQTNRRKCADFSDDCWSLDCLCQCCDRYFCGEDCVNTKSMACSGDQEEKFAQTPEVMGNIQCF